MNNSANMKKRFAIFSNMEKDPAQMYLKRVEDIILRQGGEVARKIHMNKGEVIREDHLGHADILITLGGDGTFLSIARQVFPYPISVLGINIGSLGFLTEIEAREMEESIGDILQGKYSVVRRMMLEANIIGSQDNHGPIYALNDVALSRGDLSKIIRLTILFNGSLVDTFPGDGVIVSTPMGSTGYSLSAGGPVVEHTEELMILTPICPHARHAKSFITSQNTVIDIQMEEPKHITCILTADGQEKQILSGGERVVITRSKHSVSMVKMARNSFYETLRNKIFCRSK